MIIVTHLPQYLLVTKCDRLKQRPSVISLDVKQSPVQTALLLNWNMSVEPGLCMCCYNVSNGVAMGAIRSLTGQVWLTKTPPQFLFLRQCQRLLGTGHALFHH